MPFSKVAANTDTFGIISHSRHLEFKERHFTKALETPRAPISKPPEVTEEFINQFNSAQKPGEQERFLDTAEKLLHRCKRRCGYTSMGTGSHVDLPRAWTELILLAQCKGKIQEDSLDILLVSLDNAPLEPDHSPVLFFLAESVLYRICCDAVQKPHLYSSEVKLSKLGLLIFLRLHCLHLSDQLLYHEEHKQRLCTYLRAIPACEESYLPYPNVLSALHVMLKVGKLVCGAMAPRSADSPHNRRYDKKQSGISASHSIHPKPEERGPEMSHFLWHSLLAWFCVTSNSSHLDDVLCHLSEYKEELLSERWLDSILAVFVMGEAAKLNMSCLKVLLDVLRIVIPNTHFLQNQEDVCRLGFSFWPWEVIYIFSMVLGDICVNANTSEMQKIALVGFQDEAKSVTRIDEVLDTSLCGLLRHCVPHAYNNSVHMPQQQPLADQLFWIIRYSAVYNLVKVCSALRGDVNREGLRNAAWTALHKHLINEEDNRVLEAVKVAEAEINGPANPFISTSAKTPSTPCSSQHVGWRLTSALAQLFLPPAVPHIPLPKKPAPKQPVIKRSEAKLDSTEKKVSELTIRRTFLEELEDAYIEATEHRPEIRQPEAPSEYVTRTEVDFKRIIERQWHKELDIQMKEEQIARKKEVLEKLKKEEERFKEVMKKREEKLKKTTKPYQLSDNTQKQNADP